MTKNRMPISAASLLAALSFFAAQPGSAALANRAVRANIETGGFGLSSSKRSADSVLPAPTLQSAGFITASPLSRTITPTAAKIAAGAASAVLPQALSALAWEPAPTAADTAEVLSQHRQDSYLALIAQLAQSGAGLSSEQNKDLSAGFFAPAAPARVDAAGAIAAAPGRGLTAALAAPAPEARSSYGRPAPQPFTPAQGWRQSLQESIQFARIYLDSYRWYNFTHLQDLWTSYVRKHDAAQAYGRQPAVLDARSFFVEMRIMISSGRFNIVGFSSRTDSALLNAARGTFHRYFDAAGTDAEAAFERFLVRAEAYNRAKRAHSYMSRQIRDTLLEASHKPAEDLAGFFDAKLQDDNQDAAEEFQRERMLPLLAEFKQVMLDTMAEEDSEDPDRVVGILLFGGFARGSATANSDFDVEAITVSGSPRRLPDFKRRMHARWVQAGQQAPHPINMHDYALLASKSFIRRLHNNNYIIVSPEAAMTAALSHRASDPHQVQFVCEVDAKAQLSNAVLRLVANTATYWQDLKTELGR
jgi:hypothetical protein